jgi:hypothetical protein
MGGQLAARFIVPVLRNLDTLLTRIETRLVDQEICQNQVRRGRSVKYIPSIVVLIEILINNSRLNAVHTRLGDVKEILRREI